MYACMLVCSLENVQSVRSVCMCCLSMHTCICVPVCLYIVYICVCSLKSTFFLVCNCPVGLIAVFAYRCNDLWRSRVLDGLEPACHSDGEQEHRSRRAPHSVVARRPDGSPRLLPKQTKRLERLQQEQRRLRLPVPAAARESTHLPVPGHSHHRCKELI